VLTLTLCVNHLLMSEQICTSLDKATTDRLTTINEYFIHHTQARLQRINTLPIAPYGTAHPSKRFAEPLTDLGSPTLTAEQQRVGARLRRVEASFSANTYVCK